MKKILQLSLLLLIALSVSDCSKNRVEYIQPPKWFPGYPPISSDAIQQIMIGMSLKQIEEIVEEKGHRGNDFPDVIYELDTNQNILIHLYFCSLKCSAKNQVYLDEDSCNENNLMHSEIIYKNSKTFDFVLPKSMVNEGFNPECK